MPVDQTAKLDVQQAGSFKQTVEETLGKENVVIDVIQLSPDEKTRQPTLQIQQNKRLRYRHLRMGWRLLRS